MEERARVAAAAYVQLGEQQQINMHTSIGET